MYSGIIVMCEALFGGLKFGSEDCFLGQEFCGDFSWVKDYGAGLFWRLTKRVTQGSRFNGKQSYSFAILQT